MFTTELSGRKLVGTVGALQFDVIQYRLEHEYGAKCTYEPVNLHKACWVSSNDDAQMKDFMSKRKRELARDKDGKLVFLAESAWALQLMHENFPKIVFKENSDD